MRFDSFIHLNERYSSDPVLQDKSVPNDDGSCQSPGSISRSPAHLSEAGTCVKDSGRKPAG